MIKRILSVVSLCFVIAGCPLLDNDSVFTCYIEGKRYTPNIAVWSLNIIEAMGDNGIFLIELYDEEGFPDFVPEEKTYDLNTNEKSSSIMFGCSSRTNDSFCDDDKEGQYYSTSGSITITSSTPERLEGFFETTVRLPSSQEDITLEITDGVFNLPNPFKID